MKCWTQSSKPPWPNTFRRSSPAPYSLLEHGAFFMGDYMTDLPRSIQLIEAAAERLGRISIAKLQDAARVSADKLETAKRTAVSTLAERRELVGSTIKATGSEPIDIVVFGSMARGEMSEEASDFDHILLAYGRITEPDEIQNVRLAAEAAKRAIELKPAGAFGSFGGLFSALDLVNLIGLDRDTNKNQTNRILLLEESTSLLNSSGRQELVNALLDRYLYDYRRGPGGKPFEKKGVPRFLLNDVARFWRTLCVDYQSKRWEEIEGEKWGTRYLKLLSTRKLVYAGTLVSLFLPRMKGETVTSSFLGEQFELTPLARLMQLADFTKDAPTLELLGQVLGLANYFCERLSDEEFRKIADTVQHPRDPDAPVEFKETREETRELEDTLEKLFRSEAPIIGAPPVKDGGEPLTLAYLRDRYLLF